MEAMHTDDSRAIRFFRAALALALLLFVAKYAMPAAGEIVKAAGGYWAREGFAAAQRILSACFVSVLTAAMVFMGFIVKARLYKAALFCLAAVNAVLLAYVILEMPDLHGTYSATMRALGAFNSWDSILRNALTLFSCVVFILSGKADAGIRICGALALPAILCRVFLTAFGYSLVLHLDLADALCALAVVFTALSELAEMMLLVLLAKAAVPALSGVKSLTVAALKRGFTRFTEWEGRNGDMGEPDGPQ